MKKVYLLILLFFLSVALIGCDMFEDLGKPIIDKQGETQEDGENEGDPQGEGQDNKVEYTITFDSNGGSSVASIKVEENTKASKPTDPTKDSYTFEGWYLGDTLFNFESNITSDITLTAKWKLTPTHTPGISANVDTIELNVGDELDALDGMVAIDEYGNDKLSEVSVNHFAPVDESKHLTQAGEYVISYNLNINGTNYSYSRTLIVNEVEVVVETSYADFTISFMDGTVGSPYTSTNWTQEVYYSDWSPASNQMNCREKNGVRVVNFTSGFNTTYRYTYNNGTSLGIANKLTFKAGNYFSPNQPIPIKIILIDVNGDSHYILGSSDAFYSFEATTDLVDQELIFEEVEVASLRVVCKGGASAYQYFYVSAMHLEYEEGLVVPSGDNGGNGNTGGSGETIDDHDGVNLFADLPASGNDYVSPNWKIENYRSSDWFGINNEENWGVMSTVQMRSRMRGTTHVANFACGNTPMRYTFSKGDSLGVANTLSFKLANDWNPTGDIYIILKLKDVNGNEIYLFGSSSSYDTIPVQELTDYKLTFNEAEIKEIVIMMASTTASTYLYMGDAYLYNEAK